VDRTRTGLAAGVGAYVLWGLFPLYWPLLDAAGSVEVLAHRIAWSLVVVGVLLALGPGFRWARTLGRRRLGLLALAAVLITVNWGTFIHATTSGQVVDASLGYFINPLVSVALGVTLLGERLRRAQWAAVAIASVAVVVLTVDHGRPPWIALILAFSFGIYGFVKKRADVGGVESLAVETAILLPAALGYLAVLGATGEGTFTSEGTGHALLLAGGGIATAVPLVLFGAAAIRIPLSTIGLLQYLAPVMQFLIGVLLFEEPMPLGRLLGFVLVWIALAVFAADAVRALRRARPRPEPSPAAVPLAAARAEA
jgi:chloramphenicol-sensitive protein RarD